MLCKMISFDVKWTAGAIKWKGGISWLAELSDNVRSRQTLKIRSVCVSTFKFVGKKRGRRGPTGVGYRANPQWTSNLLLPTHWYSKTWPMEWPVRKSSTLTLIQLINQMNIGLKLHYGVNVIMSFNIYSAYTKLINTFGILLFLIEFEHQQS